MILTKAFSTIQFIVCKVIRSAVISLAMRRSAYQSNIRRLISWRMLWHLISLLIEVNLGNKVCLKSYLSLVV